MKNIYLKYRKIALVAAIAMSTSGVLAYEIRIKNITGYEVKVTVEQAPSPSCQSEDVIIPNGQERTVTTGERGTCCADLIVVRGTKGPILGKEARSNFVIACQDYYFTIKKTADNGLVIE